MPRPLLLVALAFASALGWACLSRSTAPAPKDEAGSLEARRFATACEEARHSPSFLGMWSTKWDGGSCGAYASGTLDHCSVSAGWRSWGGIVDTSSRASCGGIISVCDTSFVCVCGQTDQQAAGRAPRVEGATESCLPSPDAGTWGRLERFDCEPPPSGTPRCHGELAGAVSATITNCQVETTQAPNAELAQLTVRFSEPSMPLSGIDIDFPEGDSLPRLVPGLLVRQQRGVIRLPDAGSYLLASSPQDLGYIALLEQSRGQPRQDAGPTVRPLHGCLSARFDEEHPTDDGGRGAVYLRLSF